MAARVQCAWCHRTYDRQANARRYCSEKCRREKRAADARDRRASEWERDAAEFWERKRRQLEGGEVGINELLYDLRCRPRDDEARMMAAAPEWYREWVQGLWAAYKPPGYKPNTGSRSWAPDKAPYRVPDEWADLGDHGLHIGSTAKGNV